MTETRINQGELPYGLPPYPSPPYGDPLGLDPLAPPRRDPDAWTGFQASQGMATRPPDPAPSPPWAVGQDSTWGVSQSGQFQVGVPGGGLPYGNPISPPYGMPPYTSQATAADAGAYPGAYPGAAAPYAAPEQPSGAYGVAQQPAYPTGQYQAPPATSLSSPYGQPAAYVPDYPAPSGQYAAPAYPDPAAQVPAAPYADPSGQYPAAQYPEYFAPSQSTTLYTTPPSGQYPTAQPSALPQALSGQYPAQAPSGQYPAADPGGYGTGQAPYAQYAAPPAVDYSGAQPVSPAALSGQYPAAQVSPVAQALSGQYPVVAPSGQYPVQIEQHTGQVAGLSGQYHALQATAAAIAGSGQYPSPAWTNPTSGSMLALPAPRDSDTPTGQHERIRQGRSTRAAARIETARVAADEDAKFLAALKSLLTLSSLFPRMIFVALGFTAIGPLALAYVEAMPLPVSARLILLPAALTVIALGLRYREWGRRALIGWVAGIIATIIYDCLRLALVKVGIWGDPIPGIGRLLLDDPDANWMWGYAWRFMGNGGGMAIAFTMLPWRGVRAGVVYGTMICLGLVAVLAFWPVAQEHFFPLTPITAAGGMAGHWVYGAVLGFITSRFLPPVRRTARTQEARPAYPAYEDAYRPAHVAM